MMVIPDAETRIARGVPTKSFRWHSWAACALALLYALPHAWWMFGVSVGFPGNSEDFSMAFERTWFSAYNVLTTVLVLFLAAAVVSLDTRLRSRFLIGIVRIGALLLLLRGGLGVLSVLAGMVASQFSWMPGFLEQDLAVWSLLWEAWFVVAGLVFLDSARESRALPRCQT